MKGCGWFRALAEPLHRRRREKAFVQIVDGFFQEGPIVRYMRKKRLRPEPYEFNWLEDMV